MRLMILPALRRKAHTHPPLCRLPGLQQPKKLATQCLQLCHFPEVPQDMVLPADIKAVLCSATSGCSVRLPSLIRQCREKAHR